MTQPTIRMSVSNIDVKKSRAGLALSPPIAKGNTQQQADHDDAERVAFAHFPKSTGGDQLIQNVFPRPTQRVFVAFVGRFDPGGRTRALVLGFGLSGQVGGGFGIKITRLDQGDQGGPDGDGDGHRGQVVEDRGSAHQPES